MNLQTNTEVTGTCEGNISSPRRMPDEPWHSEQAVPYHVMLQNEIDALRDEVKKLRIKLLYVTAEPKFLGFRVRHYDASDDDCQRTTYEAHINGQWQEIVTCGLRWDEDEALESVYRILKKAKKK